MMELPRDFVQLMRRHLGDEQAETLFQGLSQEPSVSVRLNRAKTAAQPSFEPVPWCSDAYYLPNRLAFTFDPMLHAGVYYVQEAASMYLAHVLQEYMPQGTLTALDLCAAPGGKSTLLRAMLSADSLLVSNEPMRQRAQVLAENMTKWGSPDCVVTQNYPADFAHLTDAFDVALIDAPCSGEGMFRKDETAVREWSMDNVLACQQRQRQILSDIWPALKPGALVVYSTCTFNRLEDEDNAAWLAATLGATLLEERHFFPGRDRGEGFYLAALRKHGEWQPTQYKAARATSLPVLKGQYELQKTAAEQRALPVLHAEFVKKLQRTLHVLQGGVLVSELKGRDWVPAHALALCTDYVRGTYPEVALDYPQAIAYLRREVVRCAAPRGFVLLTYGGIPLGFAKSVGNRLNNMYPQEWRIRTTYTPEETPSLL